MFDHDKMLFNAFLKALDRKQGNFDERVCMVREQALSRGYHTTISEGFVHRIRESLEYAAALLYSGNSQYFNRAEEVIKKVLSLQDTDEASKTYGVWPYFLEEPLEKMDSPDWNWADFNAKQLICIYCDHQDRISRELLVSIKEAIQHAAYSIKRRNVGPDYTNISLMGAFVCIMAGELFHDGILFDYGKFRLGKALEYTKFNGAFTEYNSPAYAIVALEEIGRMVRYFNDKEAVDIAWGLNDYAWKCMAEHYHPATKQLSGPHARCYNDIQGNRFRTFIYLGTQGALAIIREEELEIDLQWLWITIACPEKYVKYFESPVKVDFLKETYYRPNRFITDDEQRTLIREAATPALEARTYSNEVFSLGTFTKSDLWNQRRALMLYWGTAEKCSYLRLRCLHDGRDYCSAVLVSSQIKNQVVGGVNFVTDHGDFHFILDPLKEGSITAKSLCIRFELGGFIDDIAMPEKIDFDAELQIKTGDIVIGMNIVYGKFDDFPVRLTAGSCRDKVWIDAVLYEGQEKAIDFAILKEAVLLFKLSVCEVNKYPRDEKNCFMYTRNEQENTLQAEIQVEGVTGRIELPLKPCSYIEDLTRSRVE